MFLFLLMRRLDFFMVVICFPFFTFPSFVLGFSIRAYRFRPLRVSEPDGHFFVKCLKSFPLIGPQIITFWPISEVVELVDFVAFKFLYDGVVARSPRMDRIAFSIATQYQAYLD